METWRPQKNEPLVPLVFPCLTLFTVSDIPAPSPTLLSCVPPLRDSFIFHQSATALRPSPPFSSHPRLFFLSSVCPSARDKWCTVLELLVLSGGGDRPWLACRPTAGPNDAGWGSAVRQATGWDCGNYWESGGVLISATALREHAGINWNYISISKELSSVQNTSILNMLNIGWRLFCETDNRIRQLSACLKCDVFQELEINLRMFSKNSS